MFRIFYVYLPTCDILLLDFKIIQECGQHDQNKLNYSILPMLTETDKHNPLRSVTFTSFWFYKFDIIPKRFYQRPITPYQLKYGIGNPPSWIVAMENQIVYPPWFESTSYLPLE